MISVDISSEETNKFTERFTQMNSEFLASVVNGLKNRPEVFFGAAKRYMDGLQRDNASENALLSAMHNFNRVV